MSNSPALFTTPTQALPSLQPQSDPTMPNVPASDGGTYQGMNPIAIAQLAKVLGNGQLSVPLSPLGQQPQGQMTAQGYPSGGAAQQMNMSNFMGQQPASSGWYGGAGGNS